MHTAALWVALLWLGPQIPLDSVTLVASDCNGVLYDIDQRTGEATNPRSGERIVGLIGISQGPDGMLYGISTSGGFLYRIDPDSGISELVGPTGLSRVFEGDLDFDPVSGIFYSIGDAPDKPRSNLTAVAIETGLATIVGEMSETGDYSAMAFDDDGTLYALDYDRVVIVDVATASIVSEVPLRPRVGVTAGMDFDPVTGIPWVVDRHDRVFRLELGTGRMELVNPDAGTPYGFCGLEFVGPLRIEIDIRPHNSRNPVHPASRGVIPVAILGSESFDVSGIDPTTLGFGPNRGLPAHRNGPHRAHVNQDRIKDLLVHFRIEESGILPTDAWACVSGSTLAGSDFEGCDRLSVVPPVSRRD